MTQYSVEQVSEAYGKHLDQLAELEAGYRNARADLDTKLANLNAWLWKHTEHTADSLVEEYVLLRDKRSEIKKDFDEEDKKVKAQMERREVKLLEMLKAVGAESFRTEHGTAFTQDKVRSNAADWEAYWAWMGENNRSDGVEKRVSQGMISKMLEEGKELPPGITIFSEKVVIVRKS